MSVQNNAKWYILHTYSGYESLVKKSIEQMVENGNLQDVILDTKIPTETLIEEKNGKKKAYEAKVMPCYVFVELVYCRELSALMVRRGSWKKTKLNVCVWKSA